MKICYFLVYFCTF